MTAPVRPNERLREDYHWTTRQREVLWMLVKGYNNGRIADELGVSLDGAKWHVREIMSKLGVDSRDEAAEYWRAYNGLSLRFSRLFRAVVGVSSLRWAAGVTVATAMVAAGLVAVAIIVARNQGDEAIEGDGDLSNPTAANTPSGTGSPTPGAPGAVRTLTLAPAVQSVSQAVLYTVSGCFQCDGADESLQRHITGASGLLRTTTVLESNQGPLAGWKLGAVDGAPDGSLLLAVACDQAECGGVGPGNPSTRWRVVGSIDGGSTWRDAFSATANYVQVSSVSAGGFTALIVNGPEEQRQRAFVAVTTSGQRRLDPPAGFPAGAEPVLLGDGRVLWVAPDGLRLADEQGGDIALVFPEGATRILAGGVRTLAGGQLAVSFIDGSDPLRYGEILQVYDAGLAPIGAVRSEPAFRVLPMNGAIALANVVGTDIGLADPATVYPALVSLGDGVLTPVTAPVFTDERGRNRFVALLAGSFVTVNAGGDCLNVREQPALGAAPLACLSDGTLLADRGETRAADGMSWQAVALLDGREGWAATEFLTR